MATITAPFVVEMGIPVLAAHMFVFFFGIVADITPPVALAAYAGSAIAHSNPLKTGVQATKLAIAAFIIPYVFALSPEILWIDTDAFEVIRIVITSLIGMVAISAGLEGYLMISAKIWERVIFVAAGLLLVIPSIETDIIGIILLVICIVLQLIRKSKSSPKKKTA
jgi:TRAP-type uncharacterized transport system fused permease subunit